MEQKTHDSGLTIKKAMERIYEREDNMYTKKTIYSILKLYAEECLNALVDGEKVYLRDVGTIRPDVVTLKHCGLPTVTSRENTSLTIVKVRVRTSNMLKRRLKEKLENGELKGDNQCLEE